MLVFTKIESIRESRYRSKDSGSKTKELEDVAASAVLEKNPKAKVIDPKHKHVVGHSAPYGNYCAICDMPIYSVDSHANLPRARKAAKTLDIPEWHNHEQAAELRKEMDRLNEIHERMLSIGKSRKRCCHS